MFFSSGAAQTNGGGSLCMATYSLLSCRAGREPHRTGSEGAARGDALACRQPWKPWGRRERGREGDGRAVVVVGVKGDKAGVSEPCAARGSYICSHSDAEVPLLQSPTANLNQLSTTVQLPTHPRPCAIPLRHRYHVPYGLWPGCRRNLLFVRGAGSRYARAVRRATRVRRTGT